MKRKIKKKELEWNHPTQPLSSTNIKLVLGKGKTLSHSKETNQTNYLFIEKN